MARPRPEIHGPSNGDYYRRVPIWQRFVAGLVGVGLVVLGVKALASGTDPWWLGLVPVAFGLGGLAYAGQKEEKLS